MFSRSDLSIPLTPTLNWIYMCIVTSMYLTVPNLVHGNTVLTPIPDSVIPVFLALLISWPWFAPIQVCFSFLSSRPWAMVGRLLNGPSIFDLDLQSHNHMLSQEPTFSTVLKFQASSLEDISLASTGTSQINTCNIKPWYHLYAVVSPYLTECQVYLASPLLLTTGNSASPLCSRTLADLGILLSPSPHILNNGHLS